MKVVLFKKNVGYCRKIAASEDIVHFSPTAADIQFSTIIQSGLTYVQLNTLCSNVSGQRQNGQRALLMIIMKSEQISIDR